MNSALGTETLDCSSAKYLFRLQVGSTGYFGEVQIYEVGKKDFIVIDRDKLKIAHLNWKKKELKLEYTSTSENLFRFNVNVKGRPIGTLQIDGKSYKIKCDW
jgi:hypothetical protein